MFGLREVIYQYILETNYQLYDRIYVNNIKGTTWKRERIAEYLFTVTFHDRVISITDLEIIPQSINFILS